MNFQNFVQKCKIPLFSLFLTTFCGISLDLEQIETSSFQIWKANFCRQLLVQFQNFTMKLKSEHFLTFYSKWCKWVCLKIFL